MGSAGYIWSLPYCHGGLCNRGRPRRSSALPFQAGMKEGSFTPPYLGLVSLEVAIFHRLGCLSTMGAHIIHEPLFSTMPLILCVHLYLLYRDKFQQTRWSHLIWSSLKPAVALHRRSTDLVVLLSFNVYLKQKRILLMGSSPTSPSSQSESVFNRSSY